MIFGQTSSIAIEMDIVEFPFGPFRVWIGGYGVGDYARISSAAAMLGEFIELPTLPQLDEFAGDAQSVFTLMKNAAFTLDRSSDPPYSKYAQKYIQYFFAPGYAPFDDWWGLLLPLGPRIRFLFRRHDEESVHDVVVPTEEVLKCTEDANAWVERTCNMRWTTKGYVERTLPPGEQ